MNEWCECNYMIVLYMLCHWINLKLLSSINLDWIHEFCTDPIGIDFVYKF